jgi:hypothetical protein
MESIHAPDLRTRFFIACFYISLLFIGKNHVIELFNIFFLSETWKYWYDESKTPLLTAAAARDRRN